MVASPSSPLFYAHYAHKLRKNQKRREQGYGTLAGLGALFQGLGALRRSNEQETQSRLANELMARVQGEDYDKAVDILGQQEVRPAPNRAVQTLAAPFGGGGFGGASPETLLKIRQYVEQQRPDPIGPLEQARMNMWDAQAGHYDAMAALAHRKYRGDPAVKAFYTAFTTPGTDLNKLKMAVGKYPNLNQDQKSTFLSEITAEQDRRKKAETDQAKVAESQRKEVATLISSYERLARNANTPVEKDLGETVAELRAFSNHLRENNEEALAGRLDEELRAIASGKSREEKRRAAASAAMYVRQMILDIDPNAQLPAIGGVDGQQQATMSLDEFLMNLPEEQIERLDKLGPGEFEAELQRLMQGQ